MENSWSRSKMLRQVMTGEWDEEDELAEFQRSQAEGSRAMTHDELIERDYRIMEWRCRVKEMLVLQD